MEIALTCFVKREGPNGTVRQHPESVTLLTYLTLPANPGQWKSRDIS